MKVDTDDQDVQLRQILQAAGLIEGQVEVYAQEIRQGRTLLAVSADDEQRDRVADVLYHRGGEHLGFHGEA
jgi:hypothetical protein